MVLDGGEMLLGGGVDLVELPSQPLVHHCLFCCSYVIHDCAFSDEFGIGNSELGV